MSRKNVTPKNYNLAAIIMHWVSAITVIGMFVVGVWMVDLSYYSSWYKTAPEGHKAVGIMLAILTVGRFVWKLLSASPETEGTKFEKIASKLAHLAMYGFLAALFVSGYLISTSDGRGIEVFGLFTVPGAGELFEHQSDLAGNVHMLVAWSLIGIVAIHVLAAVKHHAINKDQTLNKMLGKSKA
ncbi:cytochrome b [Vibrio parahaemolyticus]